MTRKPRLGWLRFRLRSLLIVVTVLCCWLGWQMSIVRERRAVLNEIRGSYAFHVTTATAWRQWYSSVGTLPPDAARISWSRSLLGDQAIQEIWFTRGTIDYSDDRLEQLKRAFPEAEVHEVLPIPCHPGCFPRGTMVHTPQGARPIEQIVVGDVLTIVQGSERLATARVQSVFVTDNRLWQVETDDGVLYTTETQPLCLDPDKVLPAGKLEAGMTLLRTDPDGVCRAVRVRSVTATGRLEQVYNVVLGDCEIFIANGYLARSKPPVKGQG